MLILSRKNGQKIIINDNIKITILDSKYDSCKIAIDAPRDVKIYREEVYQQIQENNKLARQTSLESLDCFSDIVVNNPKTVSIPAKTPIKKNNN